MDSNDNHVGTVDDVLRQRHQSHHLDMDWVDYVRCEIDINKLSKAATSEWQVAHQSAAPIWNSNVLFRVVERFVFAKDREGTGETKSERRMT